MTTAVETRNRPTLPVARESEVTVPSEGSIFPQRYWLGLQLVGQSDVYWSINPDQPDSLDKIQVEFCAPIRGGSRPELLIPMTDVIVAMLNDNEDARADGLVCPEDCVVLLRGDGARQRLKIEIVDGVAEVGIIGHDRTGKLSHEKATYTFTKSPFTVAVLGNLARVAKGNGHDVFKREESQLREIESNYDYNHGL